MPSSSIKDKLEQLKNGRPTEEAPAAPGPVQAGRRPPPRRRAAAACRGEPAGTSRHFGGKSRRGKSGGVACPKWQSRANAPGERAGIHAEIRTAALIRCTGGPCAFR